VIPRALRFRRFSLRLLALLLGLLFAVLATTYWVVSRANERTAHDHARANLELTARIVSSTIGQRIESLAGNAKVMTGDDALKQVRRTGNNRTLASLLQSFSTRVNAPGLTFYNADGDLLATSDPAMENENADPFRFLIREAIDQDLPQHTGFSYLKQELHVLIVVPYYAPYPNVFGWFGLAFPIDRAFAWKIRETTAVQLTYVSLDPPDRPRVLATTLPDHSLPPVLAAVLAANRDRLAHTLPPPTEIVALPDDRYVTLIQFRAMLGEDPVALVLQRPLTPELRSARDLENYLLLTSLVALAAAAVLALVLSRSISEPVRQLAAHTEKIAAGDYASRLTLDRADELGQLATAMNQMSVGLSERDRVRDLLDKNVSPEVAAALLRDGSALGGQEREVTILFADLRGFTTLSEKLTPHELLTLLNRYLDRMSAAIEAHGGVIDKFIGDAIMALFGAPVAQADAADRALAAALAMEKALVQLNTELAAEGIAPLAIGIGVNTARVIAGNIGSHRRLNYSVIGDGVNVASRLQSLTRTPEYHTNVITSAATLAACRPTPPRSPSSSPPSASSPLPTFRPLGTVPVKGRAEPVEIFAVG
jgi:adenylate cyclase